MHGMWNVHQDLSSWRHEYRGQRRFLKNSTLQEKALTWVHLFKVQKIISYITPFYLTLCLEQEINKQSDACQGRSSEEEREVLTELRAVLNVLSQVEGLFRSCLRLSYVVRMIKNQQAQF